MRSAQHDGEGTVECARKASERKGQTRERRKRNPRARETGVHARNGKVEARRVHKRRSVTSSPPLEFGSHRWAEVKMRKNDGRTMEERRKSDGRAMEERWKSDGSAMEVPWKSSGSSEKVFLEEREMFGEGLPGRATGVRECSGRAHAELAPSLPRWSGSSALGLPSQSHRPQLSPGKAKCCRCGTSTRLSHPSSFASRSRPDSGSTTSCLVLNGVRPQLLASSQFDTARIGGVALGRSRPAAAEACAS